MEPIWKTLDYNEMNYPPPEAKAGAESQTSPPAQPETSNSEILVSRDIDRFDLIIISGAIMMFIGLFMDLYTVSFRSIERIPTPLSGYKYYNLDFAILNDLGTIDRLGLHWSGTILPLVLLFVFPSLAFLCVIYSLAAGQRFKHRWRLLSLLSIAALMTNFLHLLVFFMRDSAIFVMPQTGWVLALTGALTIGIGSRSKSLSNAASAPGTFAAGLLIILAGAVMMLISLTLDWYSLYNIDGYGYGSIGFEFPGRFPIFSLPIIAIIIISSLSAIYSLVTGRHFKQLWRWLGIMAAVILIANLIAILRWGWASDVYSALPRAGWFLSLAGAAAIGLGSWRLHKKSSQEG